MRYIVLLTGGLIGGFLLPPQPKKVGGAVMLALLYVALVFGYSLAEGHDSRATLGFFLLQDISPVSEPGLRALIFAADMWVLSVLFGFVRLLLLRRRRPVANGSPNDRAA